MLNDKQIKQFTDSIKLGDIVKIEYEKGLFKKAKEATVGYVHNLNDYYVGLTSKQSPSKMPGDYITFKAMLTYTKL